MSSEANVAGIRRRKGVNPVTYVFREKARPTKRRLIRGFRMDETPDSWAVHQKLYFKGHLYVRHVTEWFQKSLFELVKKGYGPVARKSAADLEPSVPVKHRGWPKGKPRKPRAEVQPCESSDAATVPTKSPEPIIAPSAAPPVSESSWAAENPALAAMAGLAESQAPERPQPKSPPPAITLADDESDDPPTPAQLASASQGTSGPRTIFSGKPGDIKSERPGEYNPLAHPDKIAGELEDLVIFDEHVTANYLATQSRLKMMKLRAQNQRKPQPTRNNPIITMAE